jgi:hypothetical protein
MRRAPALILAMAAAAAAAAPAAASTERFEGPGAQQAAGDFLSGLLSYGDEYSPGLLAVRYVPVYDRAFATIVRFAPSRGHQVVMGKLQNRPDLEAGGSCASFRLVVEHFTTETLDGLARARQDTRIAVEREDVVRADVCVAVSGSVRVEVKEVVAGAPAEGRTAFGIPFAQGPDGGI